MPKHSRDVEHASQMLLKALATVNEAHLANFARKKVPEIELVKHVKKKLVERLGSKNVSAIIKGFDDRQGDVVFLRQPDVDLLFPYQNMLFGVEFKLLRKGISFYGGLEEAIAYSTYGVDYSWIVHFFRKRFKNARSYQKWMRFIIERSECRSVGYIASTAQSPEVIVYPEKPFERAKREDLEKLVLRIRKRLFSS